MSYGGHLNLYGYHGRQIDPGDHSCHGSDNWQGVHGCHGGRSVDDVPCYHGVRSGHGCCGGHSGHGCHGGKNETEGNWTRKTNRSENGVGSIGAVVARTRRRGRSVAARGFGHVGC